MKRGGYNVRWADDDSRWLLVARGLYPRLDFTDIYSVDMTEPTPTVEVTFSGINEHSAWTGSFLPFSNRYVSVQRDYYAYGYPSPQDTIPRVINVPSSESQLLPFSNNAQTYLVEWRHMP